MKLQIKIDTGSAAFDDTPGEEIARILASLADEYRGYGRLFTFPPQGKLRDINGNTVGSAKVESSEACR